MTRRPQAHSLSPLKHDCPDSKGRLEYHLHALSHLTTHVWPDRMWKVLQAVRNRLNVLPAAPGVMSTTEVMADSSAHGRFGLELYDSGRYMRLDAAAQRALNVLKSKLDANDNFSLYGLLNRAKTPMGKRLCKVRIQRIVAWC